jgi:NitT/TauT family transport system ATP-binding protein
VKVIIEQLGKVYRAQDGHEVAALDAIDVTVEDEEFVAVLGPSGCGKSTLLNIIGGLAPSTAGRVVFEGARQPGTPLTATVFQEFALFPWRTVQANVEFGLEELGVSAATRAERARHYLEMTELTGFEGRFPHQLSGGMRQRVGIARALAVEPAVLLMDEPFSALDAQTRTLMMQELLDLWARTRQSVLYVTHNIQEAVFMADRVVVLSRRPGRVLDIATVPLDRPRRDEQYATRAFLDTVDHIWGLIKSQARAALSDGRA